MEWFVQPLLNTATALVPIAAVFILLALAVKRGKVGDAWREARAESTTNFGMWVLNYIVLVPLFLIPAIALEEAVSSVALFGGFWHRLPLAAGIVAAVLLIDLAAYWRHRLEHDPALWRIHATHHADEAITWFSVVRKHPLSRLLSMLIDSLPALAIGLPVEAVLAANVVRSWWGHFIHADVPWTLGPVGTVLISPAAHRLHHIRDETLMGFNYGNTVTVWDKLFGTYRDPAPYLNCTTGIAEGSRGFFGELKRPWDARYRRRGEDRVTANAGS